MRQFCVRMDRERSMAYLETETAENVTFYQRFGFEVTAQDTILGVMNWFMCRPAHSRSAIHNITSSATPLPDPSP